MLAACMECWPAACWCGRHGPRLIMCGPALTLCPACCCTGAGALPIPGFPHGPSTPFTYSVLGSAVVHLLAQTLVFGAAAVLVDVGVMQILRRAWAGMHRPHHHHHHHNHQHQHHGGSAVTHPTAVPSRDRASSTTQKGVVLDGPAAVGDVEAGPESGAGLQSCPGVDADVAAERAAVQAEESLEQAMVSCRRAWGCYGVSGRWSCSVTCGPGGRVGIISSPAAPCVCQPGMR